MSPDTYVICDTETTGLDPQRHAIVELALIRIEDGGEVGRLASLTWPGWGFVERADAKAWECNRIDPRAVQVAPLLSEKLEEAAELLEGATFVAHNASFDARFLEEAYRRLGWKVPWALRRTICTRQLAMEHLFPHGLTSTGMDKIRTFLAGLGVPGWEPGGDTHRAERDAEDCLRLFQMLWRKDRGEVARALGVGRG